MSLSDDSDYASDSTLETVEFEKILSTLELVAVDARKSGDYLSYSTVLDIFAGEPTRYSNEEREQILSHILEVLTADATMTKEIGWDLPALLIPYIDSDFTFDAPIRSAPGMYKVLKIFEVLAHNGNAKELFLKSNELLSSLRCSDSPAKGLVAERFYDIKVYCLFELIDSCMRRIPTLYPSKFLAMSVTSFVNAIAINESITDYGFMWKRMSTFTRNYTRPPLPSPLNVSEEELARINLDEDYLQRKLLTAFLTETLNRTLRNHMLGLSVDFFNYLQQILTTDTKYTNNYSLEDAVVSRLYECALSFDIDLTTAFKDFVDSSVALVDSIDYSLKSDEDITTQCVAALADDYKKNFTGSLVTAGAESITDSLGGILLLFAYSIGPSRVFDKVEISAKEAISMAVRLIIPGMVHSEYTWRGHQDLAVFWCWYVVHTYRNNVKKLEQEVAAVPRIILLTFFRGLLFAIMSCSSSLYFRYVVLTLVTKFLSLAPETIAYDFIMNTLQECPFENVKAAMVGVLKELSTKSKVSVSDLADKLAGAEIARTSAPPPLPSRDNHASNKYITLTESRVDDIFLLIEKYIGETFVKSGSGTNLNQQLVPTLLAFLNFLYVLKNEKAVKGKKYDDVVEQLQKYTEEVESNQGLGPVPVDGIGILKVTVERLAL